MPISADDLVHLRRCLELAREALEAGDQPFGSVLVSADGEVLHEDRNREKSVDPTRHPEFELARWSAALTPEERAGATVYTSGEHCPMCSAAHAVMGLGRVVYVASSAQLATWRSDLGVPAGSVAFFPVQEVAPSVPVDGPVPELEDEIHALHEAAARR